VSQGRKQKKTIEVALFKWCTDVDVRMLSNLEQGSKIRVFFYSHVAWLERPSLTRGGRWKQGQSNRCKIERQTRDRRRRGRKKHTDVGLQHACRKQQKKSKKKTRDAK
jgi:hypothetical protein